LIHFYKRTCPRSMLGVTDIAKVSKSLHIGSLQAALNYELLQSFSITKVLSLDTEKPVLHPDTIQLFISVSDEPSSDLLSKLPVALEFLSGDEATLVHCRHGVSRSAAVVMAFLMQTDQISVEVALERLVAVRKECLPNDGFLQQLQLFHKMGCVVDVRSPSYINFALQHGQVMPSEVVPGGVVFKCRKCRKLLCSGEQVLQHREGEFPHWWLSEQVLGSLDCRYGVVIVPPIWLVHTGQEDWNRCNRLDCYGCGTKVGCWGVASCGCGAKGGRGVVLILSKVDRIGNVRINLVTNS